MTELPITQADHVTPGRDGPRLLLHSRASSYLGYLMLGNEIANLSQDGALTSGWVERFSFIHPGLVAGLKRQPNSFLFQTVGWL